MPSSVNTVTVHVVLASPISSAEAHSVTPSVLLTPVLVLPVNASSCSLVSSLRVISLSFKVSIISLAVSSNFSLFSLLTSFSYSTASLNSSINLSTCSMSLSHSLLLISLMFVEEASFDLSAATFSSAPSSSKVITGILPAFAMFLSKVLLSAVFTAALPPI